MIQDLIRRITQLERKYDELLKPEVSRWLDWTPTVTQSGSVTVTVTYARYMTIANLVMIEARLAVTGSGTTSNAIIIGGLPFNIANTNSGHKGGFLLTDASVPTIYEGSVSVNGTNQNLRFHAHNLASPVGVTPNFGLASGDIITFSASYERD